MAGAELAIFCFIPSLFTVIICHLVAAQFLQRLVIVQYLFLKFKKYVMEENRNVNRNDEHISSNDDQLRPNTMNEAIREVSGNPEADLSKISSASRPSGSEDLQGSDQTQGMSFNPNDASGVRSGGTTDLDDQTAGGAGLSAGERLGSGTNITTRRSVTGSDFDGQDK